MGEKAPSEEAVREVAILNEALDNATAEVVRARAEAGSWRRLAEDNGTEAGRRAVELNALREAVRGFLNGAPLDEHGRFKDARLEALYRATREPDGTQSAHESEGSQA